MVIMGLLAGVVGESGMLVLPVRAQEGGGRGGPLWWSEEVEEPGLPAAPEKPQGLAGDWAEQEDVEEQEGGGGLSMAP